jgi:ABC-type multidrug transport system fused ATPase/permease subunit
MMRIPANTERTRRSIAPCIRRLVGMLTPRERRSAISLLGLMVLGMILEMVSIGLVVPAVAVMAGGTGQGGLYGVASSPNWLHDITPGGLLVIGLATLIAIYSIKTAFLAFIAWRQYRFLASLNADLSQRLFACYLGQPWTFHLERNSAELATNLNRITAITDSVSWALLLAAESLVLAGIVGVLLWFEPLGALAVCAVAGVATILLDRASRQRLARWGALHEQHATVRAKYMHQGLYGVKEALLRGTAEFCKQFTEANAAYARMGGRRSLASQLPRLWYEFVAVAALCTLTATMLVEGRSSQAMLPMLGLFAVAAFRILPSVNRFSSAMNMLRFTEPMVDIIADELMLDHARVAAKQAAPAFTFSHALVLDKVLYRYPGTNADTLQAIDVTIPAGSSVGIIGSSGAGKSTLIDIILGLLSPTAGRVVADGIDIASNIAGWQRLVGYVPQSIFLTDDTITRNVAFGIADAEIDHAAVQRAIRAAQLEQFVASLPEGLNTEVGERGVRLSGGQRQRIGIARALYHDPKILVLDEATSALDDATEREVMAAVNLLQGVKTLVIVAHRLSTVAACDMLLKLDGGRVAQVERRAEPASIA